MAGRSLVSDLSKKPTIPHIIRLCWEYTISRRWASNKPVAKLRRPLFTPGRQRALFVSYRIHEGPLPRSLASRSTCLDRSCWATDLALLCRRAQSQEPGIYPTAMLQGLSGPCTFSSLRCSDRDRAKIVHPLGATNTGIRHSWAKSSCPGYNHPQGGEDRRLCVATRQVPTLLAFEPLTS